ncbi:MAG: hypothetical protein NT166_28080 [Candidatus Aminicenantes bacterium]|nr:hypothetical protein [Candidatus Aminicenantes bacterium]
MNQLEIDLLIGVYPDDAEGIFAAKPVCIFHCQLSFTQAAQALKGGGVTDGSGFTGG